jgi:hypothetical protein
MRPLETANLLQVSDALKPPDLEPPPTCPFIKIDNVKERKRATPDYPPF